MRNAGALTKKLPRFSNRIFRSTALLGGQLANGCDVAAPLATGAAAQMIGVAAVEDFILMPVKETARALIAN